MTSDYNCHSIFFSRPPPLGPQQLQKADFHQSEFISCSLHCRLLCNEHYIHDIIGYRVMNRQVNKKQSWLILYSEAFRDIIDVVHCSLTSFPKSLKTPENATKNIL